ncbi:MAG: ribonuclease HII [Methylotenera sp.]|uniref:ribonuclease HII n=1 Tax=Methylotenera sp. TaxID=2051956 RepID=UPI000D444611|nr:ribonuclease HII [Methylotenera sp.]PPC82398.1 MAG: ribonuclease HII [Methylotenera sp.]
MNPTHLICGVDEAGRGPLAGAVYAAAVILDPSKPILGLADSKKLSEKKRDALALEIKSHAFAWGIAHSTVEEIDTINILQASLLAMQRAIALVMSSENVQASLTKMQLLVQVDGNQCPKISLPCEAIVKGDTKVQAISAASILAKTARDAALYALDQQYPMYGFAQHKGYPTAAHIALLRQHGVSPVHRRSYAPVRALISNN